MNERESDGERAGDASGAGLRSIMLDSLFDCVCRFGVEADPWAASTARARPRDGVSLLGITFSYVER